MYTYQMQQDKRYDDQSQRHGSGTRTAPGGPRRMTAAMAMDMSDEAHSNINNQQHQSLPGSYSQGQQRYANRNRPLEYQSSQRYHGYSDNEPIPSYISRTRTTDPYYGQRHNIRSRSPIRDQTGRDSDEGSYAQGYDSSTFVHPAISHESGNSAGSSQARSGVDPSQRRAQEAFQQRFAAIYQQTRAAAMQCIQQRMMGVRPSQANTPNFGFHSGVPPFPPVHSPRFPNPREQQINQDGTNRSGRFVGYRDEMPSMSVWRAKQPSQPAASQGSASGQVTETPTMSVWKAPRSPPNGADGGICTSNEKNEHASEASADEGSGSSAQGRAISAMPMKVGEGYRTDLPTMSVWRAAKPSDSSGRSTSSGQHNSPSASSRPVRLPSDVSVAEYARRRAQEIESLTQNILASRMMANVQAFQTLPRHMRRRAASYDTRRLPRRLRNIQQSQGAGAVNRKKRPSRKHRRRPSNLLTEYARRQRHAQWLETHIWHAKRFKMTELWGYKIPLHPSDKSVRACYRASAKHCLLQDISYMCCIEIRGTEANIIKGMARLTNKEVGLTVAAKMYLHGAKEGKVMLYGVDKYPQNAIGLALILWRLTDPTGIDTSRALWLWVHPSCYASVLEAFLLAFGIESVPAYVDFPELAAKSEDAVSKKKKTKVAVSRSETDDKRKPCEFSSPIAEIYTNGTVSIMCLKNKLVRFKLTGPLSQAVLHDTLKPIDISSHAPEMLAVNTEVDDDMDFCNLAKDDVTREKNSKPPVSSQKVTSNAGNNTAELKPTVDVKSDVAQPAFVCRWWEAYFREKRNAQIHGKQKDLWELMAGLQSPAELSPSTVIGLIVKDPRLLLPPKRNKVMCNSEVADVISFDKIPCEVSHCALWNEDIRCEVTATKLSEQLINKIRSDNALCGTPLDLGMDESRIPVLLVQNPGVCDIAKVTSCCQEMLGYGSGWDLIAPAGWAMAFWIALVYRGARVGGLRESDAICWEQGELSFPRDFPDTEACQKLEASEREEQEMLYLKHPPAKRPNYVKLGVQAPFHCPWAQLVSEWDSKSECPKMVKQDPRGASDKFFVLRNRKLLLELQKLMESTAKRRKVTSDKGCAEAMSVLSQLELHYPRALIPVKINVLQRGTPKCYAMICLPLEMDLNTLANDRKHGGPTEPLHKDLLTKKVLAESKILGKTGKKKKKPFFLSQGDGHESATTIRFKDGAKNDDPANELQAKSKNEVSESMKMEIFRIESDKLVSDKGGDISSSEIKSGQTDKFSKDSVISSLKIVKKRVLAAKLAEARDRVIRKKLFGSVNHIRTHCARDVIGYVTYGNFSFSVAGGQAAGFCSASGLVHALQSLSFRNKFVVLIRNTTSLQYRFAHLSINV